MIKYKTDPGCSNDGQRYAMDKSLTSRFRIRDLYGGECYPPANNCPQMERTSHNFTQAQFFQK